MNNDVPQYGEWNRTALDRKVTAIDILQANANEVVQKIVEHEIVLQMNQKLNQIKDNVKTEFQSLDIKSQEILKEQKAKLDNWVKQKIELILLRVLEGIKPRLKNNLQDPYMCGFIKNFIDDLFEEIWPDIKDQILFQVRLKYADPYELEEMKVLLTYNPFKRFRNWYLYCQMPFDREIFQTIRNFSWWIIFLIKLIPFYGIQAGIYLLIFLMIDKRDEYQLINFILAFKSMQFITLGILGTAIGYFAFYSCAIVQLNEYNYCRASGPALLLNFYTDASGFLLQEILIWIAYLIIPCSKLKGKVVFKHDNQNIPQSKYCCCDILQRKNRLQLFMIYDLIIFLCCLGLFAGLSYDSTELWQFKSTMYLAKTCYGVLSFPFLAFMIPGLKWVITRSHGTGYDRYGKCLPLVPNLPDYHKRNKAKGKPYDYNYIQNDTSFDLYENDLY